MPPETRSDAEVRADDQARVGNDAVERRAVGTASTVVRNRRAQPDAEVQRAETRGAYRDLDGRRRIVGAGQAIPDGWSRIESAVLEDREGTGPDGTPAEGESTGTTAGGGDGAKTSRGRRR